MGEQYNLSQNVSSNAKPTTIDIFDSKGHLRGRATSQRSIEFLYFN